MLPRSRTRSPLNQKASPLPRVIIGSLLLIGIIFFIVQKSTSTPKSASDSNISTKAKVAATPKPRKPIEQLQATFDRIDAENSDMQLGIEVLDFETDEKASLRPELQFFAASTAKVITATATLKKVDSGLWTLKDRVGNYSLEYQLGQMISQSNNDSWALINSKVPRTEQQAFAESLGLQNSDYVKTETSAGDLALLLQQIYQKKILSEESTKLLLSFMQDTNEESFIPAALSKNVTIYHKTGLLDSYIHDAAIIKDGESTFALVILSKGTMPDPVSRAELFAEITKATLTHFE